VCLAREGRLKERIGRLRVRQQAAEKTFRTAPSDEYQAEARNIYGLLRETWERGIEENFLNDVVERFRPIIESKRARFLHDITQADIDAVDAGMTECSRWLRGHDEAPAASTPFPEPQQLKAAIDALDAWVNAIRKRRP
jgi:hypothetical protein